MIIIVMIVIITVVNIVIVIEAYESEFSDPRSQAGRGPHVASLAEDSFTNRSGAAACLPYVVQVTLRILRGGEGTVD